MTVITDFANAMNTYPQDEVKITIVDLAVQKGTAGAINVNEKWKFKVQIDNNGHLNMTDVSLHVHGFNGVQVCETVNGEFQDLITTTQLFSIDGGQTSAKSDYLYFKAPPDKRPAGTDLVSAHIADWNGNMDHFFTNHTIHSPLPEVVYSAEILQ